MTGSELAVEREGILPNISSLGEEKALLGMDAIAMGATISKQ